jgi:hypothetical protein
MKPTGTHVSSAKWSLDVELEAMFIAVPGLIQATLGGLEPRFLCSLVLCIRIQATFLCLNHVKNGNPVSLSHTYRVLEPR